jgi:uncharacterized protein (DUF1778 family)
MDFKTTDDVKALLSEAAALTGLDLTSFVLGSATERARAVLAERSTLKLTAEQHASFMNALDNPPAPSEALRKLMSGPGLPIR